MSGPGVREQIGKPAGSGDGQTGVVATTLPTPLTVVVTSDGVPAPGVIVTFAPSGGSGSVTPAVDTTDDAGLASRPWTLGTTAGGQAVNVSIAGASPVHFTATGLPGAITSLLADTGDAQFQEPGLAFAAPLRVRALDAFGNGVPGVNVTWEVASGSGSVGAVNPTTDATGRSVGQPDAGATPGPLVIRAATPVLSGDTVLFGLVVTPVATVITIANNFFTPAEITIAPGSALRWVWNAGTHNVAQLAGPSDFRASPVQMAGASFGPVLFTTPGVYNYECSLHAGMLGKITVQ